jgi:hypothetical protein
MGNRKELGQLIENSVIEASKTSGSNADDFMNSDIIQALIKLLDEVATAKGLDAFGLCYTLGMGFTNHALFQKNEGIMIESFFNSLGISMPPKIIHLVREIEFRNNFILDIVNNNKHTWSENKKADYLEAITKEVESRSFEKKDRIHYLKSLHEQEVEKVVSVEKKCSSFFDTKWFYDGNTFVGDASSLNSYFHSGLRTFGFQELWKLVNTIIDCKNKVVLVQEYKLLLQSRPLEKEARKELDDKQRNVMQIVVKHVKDGKKITAATTKAMVATGYSKSAIEKIIRRIRNEELRYDPFSEVNPAKPK